MNNQWWDDEDISGKFIKMKVGDQATFTVKEIVKNTKAPEKFQFKKKDGTLLGFNLLIKNTEGETLTCSSFTLMGLLRDNKIHAGDVVRISHPANGKYELKLLGRKTEPDVMEDIMHKPIKPEDAVNILDEELPF